MSIKSIILESCLHNHHRSSKRIIMYIFTFVAVCMVAIEALFNILLIFKCYNSAINVADCEFKMVFDAMIYGYIFGLIAALAGINGFMKQPNDTTKKEN